MEARVVTQLMLLEQEVDRVQEQAPLAEEHLILDARPMKEFQYGFQKLWNDFVGAFIRVDVVAELIDDVKERLDHLANEVDRRVLAHVSVVHDALLGAVVHLVTQIQLEGSEAILTHRLEEVKQDRELVRHPFVARFGILVLEVEILLYVDFLMLHL